MLTQTQTPSEGENAFEHADQILMYALMLTSAEISHGSDKLRLFMLYTHMNRQQA